MNLINSLQIQNKSIYGRNIFYYRDTFRYCYVWRNNSIEKYEWHCLLTYTFINKEYEIIKHFKSCFFIISKLLNSNAPDPVFLSRCASSTLSSHKEELIPSECLGQPILRWSHYTSHHLRSRQQADFVPNIRVDGSECAIF